MITRQEEWEALLNQIEIEVLPPQGITVYPDTLQTLTLEQIQAIEVQADIILPTGYKQFCQIFGNGCFNLGPYSVAIECPLPVYNGEPKTRDLLIDWTAIDVLKDQYVDYYGTGSPELVNLFDNSFIFGLAPSTTCVFDLRTYGEDEEYDIYAIEIFNSTPYKVGRNFFEFIRDFCVGTKADEFPVLTEIMVPGTWKSPEDWRRERHPGVFSPMPLR